MLPNTSQRPPVQACGCEQFLSDRLFAAWHGRRHVQSGQLEDNPPHKAIPVGVQPAGRQADRDVARLDGRTIHQSPTFDNTDTEPGQVVVARCIDIGQDRRFPSQQRKLALHAGLADAANNLLEQARIVLGKGNVVQKE